ncbi:MAG: tetratricopeptide repeat protein [Bacilli bacterium]|nr:tetratricopeptide repeat protein [Bacilli bacterium]
MGLLDFISKKEKGLIQQESITTDIEKEKNVDPNFAEKLMSTFYVGGGLSEADYQKCEKIWKENNNDRSKVLQVVVKLCGDIDTPQTRYLRALAWSFNRVEFSDQRIKAINDYLNNELYKEAYENLVGSIERGLEYGENFHRAIMLEYLAGAYCHLKMYKEEEETYQKIYDLHIIIPNGCVTLAKYYAKRGNREKAIQLLKEEKNSILYNNDEYRAPIDKYLEELEKKERGINKHVFIGYDTFQSAFIGDKYYPELERKGMALREEYKEVFEEHRKYLENIDLYEYELKKEANEKNKKEYIFNCLSDINIFPQIQEYYIMLNSLGYDYKIEYQDKTSKEYPVFRKIISFYEKEKNYTEAIRLCDIAIKCGIKKYHGKTSIIEKKKKLEEQSKKNKNEKK